MQLGTPSGVLLATATARLLKSLHAAAEDVARSAQKPGNNITASNLHSPNGEISRKTARPCDIAPLLDRSSKARPGKSIRRPPPAAGRQFAGQRRSGATARQLRGGSVPTSATARRPAEAGNRAAADMNAAVSQAARCTAAVRARRPAHLCAAGRRSAIRQRARPGLCAEHRHAQRERFGADARDAVSALWHKHPRCNWHISQRQAPFGPCSHSKAPAAPNAAQSEKPCFTRSNAECRSQCFQFHSYFLCKTAAMAKLQRRDSAIHTAAGAGSCSGPRWESGSQQR